MRFSPEDRHAAAAVSSGVRIDRPAAADRPSGTVAAGGSASDAAAAPVVRREGIAYAPWAGANETGNEHDDTG